MTEAYTEAVGTMINSGEWNGMESFCSEKEAPQMIEEKGSDARQSTTSCVTGYSPVRDTGASQFRSFTVRSVAMFRYRRKTSASSAWR